LFNKKFRFTVLSLALKTIKLRYKNSVLGIFWSMINPLIFLLILVVVFKEINHIKNFSLYALSGLVFWNFISTAILQVLSSFIDNSNLIKSLNIKSLSFPFSALLAALINFALVFIPFFFIMFFLNYELNLSILCLIPLLLITAFFVLGVGIFLGTLNVFFRDVQLLWNTIIPAFFYFTPIAYTIDIVPEHSRNLLKFNPFFYFIESFHDIFYRSQCPNLTNWIMCFCLALLSIIIGYLTFNKFKKGFISNL
jgi:ABC-type polysaccharide/polyol phosphate export permease